MDLLGNRESVTIDGGTPETYAVDVDTNRYDADGTYTVKLVYDNAGNTTTDNDGYVYTYDYENRIETITRPSDSTIIVTYTYDALGRRIKMVDEITAANSRWYYYSDGWQVLEEYAANNSTRKAYYVWGNYIDELLFIWNLDNQYAGQVLSDHLHSPTAILDIMYGTVLERYEYNAYGKATVWEDTDTDDIWFETGQDTVYTASQLGNPYLFTGRRLDTLDTGDFEIMYYRNRYYETETGRFLQKDPLGIDPTGSLSANTFNIQGQYADGMNLYQYVDSNAIQSLDAYGLRITPIPPFDPIDPGGREIPRKKCGTCGPDVTHALIELMDQIEMDFNNLSEDEKKENCKAPFDSKTANNAWNIQTIKGDLGLGSDTSSNCPSPNCKSTITFSEECYSAYAANYAIFGRIGRLCDVSWFKLYWMIEYHKRVTHGPFIRTDLGETRDWAYWGYQKDGHGSTLPATSTHSHCKPCSKCYKGPLEYWWKPHLKNF